MTSRVLRKIEAAARKRKRKKETRKYIVGTSFVAVNHSAAELILWTDGSVTWRYPR